MSPAALKSALIAQARALGFDDCRIAPAQPAAHRALFEQWLAEGKHGDMAWLARNPERRTDPTLVLPGAKSVIVLALNYYQGGTPYPQESASPVPYWEHRYSTGSGTPATDIAPSLHTPLPPIYNSQFSVPSFQSPHPAPLASQQSSSSPPAQVGRLVPQPPPSVPAASSSPHLVPPSASSVGHQTPPSQTSAPPPSPSDQQPSTPPPAPPPAYRIARYAWNNDYHDLIEAKLRTLADFLTAHGGTQRPYVDTGPVLERDFASESGLGWGGKSAMQIHRHLGTWFFLADILTTLDLPPDAPATDHCGKCTRCITACPTQAITAPRRMDARRCISYLTIESKGPIPLEFRHAIGDRIYGCDSCLDACPWNRHAQASHEATFQARTTIFQHTLRDFLSLTDDTFRALFAKSPIKRIKRPAFLRNVCVALGNTGTPADLPALELAATDENPLIAEHALWAITEIHARHS